MTPTPPPSPSLLTRLLHHMLNPTLPVLGHPLVGAVAIPTAAVFAIHALVGAPSVLLLKSERFYDLTGALGFLTVSGLSLYLPALRARVTAKVGGAVPPAWPSPLDALTGSAGGGAGDTAVSLGWRQVVITACVMIWATRLGSYLVHRMAVTGHDSRFDGYRNDPRAFAGLWVGQALWITCDMLPLMAVSAVPVAAWRTAGLIGLTVPDFIGFGLFAAGFALEVAADRQRAAWAKGKREKTHDELFMTSGLFGVCRYPNYLGEITLWTGLSTVAGGILLRSPVLAALGLPANLIGRAAALGIAAVSPAFTAWALICVTGIPPSEQKYDRLYGNREDYRAWKEKTPRLIPGIY